MTWRPSPFTLARSLVVALLTLSTATACTSDAAQPDPPKLAVMVAVDGLRADLISRYDTLFTRGFRRLLDGGLVFTDAKVDHGITVSHAGHVTIATGRNPTSHGIVDAAFYQMGPDGERTFVDALADSTELVVGVEDSVRGASPRNVLTDGIAEWIRNQDSEARIAAIGSGEFGSLLHVFSPADVYWFMRSRGRYVTSSYYRDTLPDWVTAFNDERLPGLIEGSLDWEPVRDLSGVDLPRPDASVYEGDGVHTAFPHRYSEEVAPERQSERRTWGWLSNTPQMDQATLELAHEAVTHLDMGAEPGRTDYLAVVLGQVDNIAHWHGPLSHETLDVLLRIDAWLGDFMDFLDTEVGEGGWVLALTADHGMPNIAEFEAEQGRYGYRLSAAEVSELQDAVAALSRQGASNAEIEAEIESRSYVADAYGPDALNGMGSGDEGTGDDGTDDDFLRLYRNSYRPDRVPRLPLFRVEDGRSDIGRAGFMVRLVRGTALPLDPSVHGSPYDYDLSVPMIFFGAGVTAGSSDRPAHTVDVAPTLAALAGITPPADIDGHDLLER